MKATLYVKLDRTDLLNRIVGEWEEEHEGYYAHNPGSLDLGDICPGFPGKAAWTIQGYPHTPMRAQLGMTAFGEKDAVWLRSSGSWAAVDCNRACLTVSGPRHSIRELIPEWFREGVESWEYESSQREDLKPWETTT